MQEDIDQVKLDGMRLVDAACDRFESAYASQQAISIEELISSVPAEVRSVALREAVLVEAEIRIARGESPTEAEYVQRFPELSEEIFGLLETVRGQSRHGPNSSSTTPTEQMKAATQATISGIHLQLAPGQQFGRYRIERLLGRGGMGLVYLAIDVRLQRQVALKFPRFVDDPLHAERFEREARTMASVTHRNLCSIFDVNEFEGVHFLSMAYIEGQTLEDRLKLGQKLSYLEIGMLLFKLASATDFAHRAGVIHRDLKPANVMIDHDGEPVIMDFGLARGHDDDARLTQVGLIVGTPAYMAPEQTLEDTTQVGPHSDIYSLGAILYELLTGRVVFAGNAKAVLGQLTTGKSPVFPRAIRVDVDSRLENICMKALSHAPAKRYASAADMASALESYLTQREAYNPGAIQTKKLTSTWWTAVALCLFAGLGLIAWQLFSGIGQADKPAEPLAQSQNPLAMNANIELESATSQQASLVSKPRHYLDLARAEPDGWSLQLDGESSYVEVPGLQRDDSHPLTMEMWLRGDYQPYDCLVAILSGKRSVQINKDNNFLHAFENHDVLADRGDGQRFHLGDWTHVAAICDTVATELFVNGHQTLKIPHDEFAVFPTHPFNGFWIGAHPHAKSGNISFFYKGEIDEIRLSKCRRYAEDFQPQLRMDADSDTIALYHCDEGNGDQLLDASSHGHHGQVHSIQRHKNDDATSAGPPIATAPLSSDEMQELQSKWAQHLNTPVTESNTIGMELKLVPPGKFLMGAALDDADAQAHEFPQHVVQLTKAFQLSATEVTVEMFSKFVEQEHYVTDVESDGLGGYDASKKQRVPEYTWRFPSSIATRNFPVSNVSYADAMRFCQWLGRQEGRVYRLPTEAEWEYACRAGTQTRYWFGDEFDPKMAKAIGGSATARVSCGSYPPNPLGLFDMHGNVHELCLDAGRNYAHNAVVDPTGEVNEVDTVVVRGGAGTAQPIRLRSSHRYINDRRQYPDVDFAHISKGFRVVRELPSR